MSQENVEIVRSVYDSWAKGNFRAGRELLDPNITTVWAGDFPAAGIYHGPDEHAAAMREWLSAWTDVKLDAERFVDAGDSVVVPFVVGARGLESGALVERRWAHVWTVQNGRVVRFEVHLDVDAALKAAGLEKLQAGVPSLSSGELERHADTVPPDRGTRHRCHATRRGGKLRGASAALHGHEISRDSHDPGSTTGSP